MADFLGVVPIFVNAGAAVLPVILGAAASMLALVLRPRELVRACRRRPIAALVAALVIAAGVVLGDLALSVRPAPAAPAPRARNNGKTDWAEVALNIIRRRQAGLAGTLPQSMPSPGGDAPIVLGRDFSRCSYDGGPVPLGLRPLWQHKEEDTMFLSSPAVAGGRVYAAACTLDVAGKYGSVVCLDAATGRVVWQTSTIGPIASPATGSTGLATGRSASLATGTEESLKPFFSSPAITQDGKWLVIGQGLHEDADCSLLCLDAATGKVRWRVKTPLHVEGSPAIRGDLAVVGAGEIDHRPGATSGFVLAVRISDGAELWRYAVRDPESSPAIDEGGVVYIGSGFNGSAVLALRSESDEQLRQQGLDRLIWRAPAPYPVFGAVTLAGDLVVVGGGNGDYVFADPHPAGVVVALDRRTGAVLWKTPMDDAVLGAVPVALESPGAAGAGVGKAVCPVRSGEVVALDLTDGRPLWRQRVSGKSPILAGCALAGRYVYAASKDGFLAVIDCRDGTAVEKHPLNDQAKPGQLGLSLSSPTVAGGRVYIGSETGGLRCFVGAAPGPPAR